jgi:Na+/phosphate symporter
MAALPNPLLSRVMGALFTKIVEWQIRIAGWVMTIAMVVIAAVKFGVDLVIEITYWAFNEISAITAPDWDFNISDYQSSLALANHFFPLAEAWAMLVVTVPFMLFIVILRFVKSWIPTIAN